MFLIILIFFYISEVVEQNTIVERLFLLFLFFLFYEIFMVRRCSFQFLFSSSNYEYFIVKADFCCDGII